MHQASWIELDESFLNMYICWGFYKIFRFIGMVENGQKPLFLVDFGLFWPILDDFDGTIEIWPRHKTPNICTCLESSFRALSDEPG